MDGYGTFISLLLLFESSAIEAKCLFHKYDHVTLGTDVTSSETFQVTGSYRCEILCAKRRLECVAVHVTVQYDDTAICILYRQLPVPLQTYPDVAGDSRLLVRTGQYN
jgi:hypothetical protein